MPPEQAQGLWICLTISLAIAVICPAVLWVLPHRSIA